MASGKSKDFNTRRKVVRNSIEAGAITRLKHIYQYIPASIFWQDFVGISFNRGVRMMYDPLQITHEITDKIVSLFDHPYDTIDMLIRAEIDHRTKAIKLRNLIVFKFRMWNPAMEITAIYREILLELCEHDEILRQGDNLNENQLILNALNLFEIAKIKFQSLLLDARLVGNVVKISYRGKHYSFDKNSHIIESAKVYLK